MKKYTIFLICFVGIISTASAQNNINAYEYWFNDNYASKQKISTGGQSNFSLNNLIYADSLPDGMHAFNLRFKDNTGVWSTPLSYYFYKDDEAGVSLHQLTSYQYWFNNDFSNSKEIAVGNQQELSLNELIAADSLPGGMHTFNFRFKDNSGNWSPPVTRFFYKMPESLQDTAKIVYFEYWFNDEYSGKQNINITSQQNINLNTSIDGNSLHSGLQRINMRFKDSNGNHTSAISKYFYKKTNETVSLLNNDIIAYRYWFDGDFQSQQEVELKAPVQDFNLLDSLNLLHLTKGMHKVHFCFKDSAGFWSSAVTDSIMKNPFPIADFSFTKTMDCDSTSIQFSNQSIDGDVYLWDFGNGDTSHAENPVYTYFTPGNYVVTLTISDTSLNLDSTYQLPISVKGGNTANITAASCGSYISPSGNHVWFSSGNYLDTLTNIWGCDSVISVSLVIYPEPQIYESFSVCEGSSFTFPDGNTITNLLADTTYVSYLSTAQQCDSVINTTIYVNSLYEIAQQAETCIGVPYQWRGNFYDTTGLYYDSLLTSNGCDSIYALNLQVNPKYEYTQHATTCSGTPYSWHGHTYTASGTYYDSLHTVAGCDSIYVLNLQVNPVYEFVQQEEICNGDFYQWRGNFYNTTGLYYDSLLTNNGCDSIYALNLQVNPKYEYTQQATTCSGTPYSWHGHTYTASGTYYDSLYTVGGCDSIYVLNLQVNPVYEFVQQEEICNGDFYQWQGKTYNMAGIYYDSLLTSEGCDSVYVLELDVFSVDDSVFRQSITLTAQAANATFRWLDCDNNFSAINGAIQNAYIATSNGSYAVEITQNNCVDTSKCFDITEVSVNKLMSENIVKIYPNPNQGRFSIYLPQNYRISIYTSIGECIFKQDFDNGKHQIEISNITPGVYFLKAEKGYHYEVIKLVVKQ